MTLHSDRYYGCTRKVRHETRQAARQTIKSMRARKPIEGVLTSYKCKFCGGWHVGNQSPGVQAIYRKISSKTWPPARGEG
jgi:hypothetical protein